MHAIVDSINRTLGGPSIPTPGASLIPSSSIADIAGAIGQGRIKTLLVLGGNPAFNAPAELGFADLLTKVEQVIRLGLHVDETSATSTTHVPAAHFLESWGDAISYSGTYLSIQPLILPLYNGISNSRFSASSPGTPRRRARNISRRPSPASRWAMWPRSRSLTSSRRSGASSSTTASPTRCACKARRRSSTSGSTRRPSRLQPDEYELVFTLGLIDDGRYANNGWLQELPEPVTKLTWDNALLVSPTTATKLCINVGTVNDSSSDLPDTDFGPRVSNSPIAIDPTTAYPMAKVTTPDGRSLEVAVLVSPGQHDQTLVLALGWGRTAPKLTDEAKKNVTSPLRVADGAGFNAYTLRTTTTPGFVTGVKVEKIDTT